MLELLEFLSNLLELVDLVVTAVRHWRISCSVLIAASVVGVLCLLTQSPALRLIVGGHVALASVVTGIWWDFNS